MIMSVSSDITFSCFLSNNTNLVSYNRFLILHPGLFQEICHASQNSISENASLPEDWLQTFRLLDNTGEECIRMDAKFQITIDYKSLDSAVFIRRYLDYWSVSELLNLEIISIHWRPQGDILKRKICLRKMILFSKAV